MDSTICQNYFRIKKERMKGDRRLMILCTFYHILKLLHTMCTCDSLLVGVCMYVCKLHDEAGQ